MLYSFLTPSAYIAARIAMFKESEGNKELPYYDTVGIPTIGIGFNIHNNSFNRKLVLKTLGLDVDLEINDPNFQAFESSYIDQITQILSIRTDVNSDQNLQSSLDQIMLERSNDPVIREFLGTSNLRNSFRLTQSEIDATFNVVIEQYEQALTEKISSSDISRERLALISLKYNEIPGESPLLGNNLLGALERGDRFGAWYEIRYRSNAKRSASQGIANRRYRESDLFGLFDGNDPNNITKEGALKFLGWAQNTFDPNAPSIKAYEYIKTYENKYSPTNTDAKSYSYKIFPEILINNYSEGVLIDINNVNVGNELSNKIDGTVNNDLIFGENGADTLKGQSGNDVIYGGKGDNDQLYGGSGNDIYVFNRGDGKDTVFDTDGLDKVVFGDDISFSDLLIDASSTSLRIGIREGDFLLASLKDIVTIDNYTTSSFTGFEVGGVFYSRDDLFGQNIQTDYDDVIHLSGASELAYGSLGNDTWYFAGGNDTLVYSIGEGHDTLSGVQAVGSAMPSTLAVSTYSLSASSYALADTPTLGKFEEYSLTTDTIRFTEGITADNISISLNNSALEIQINNNDSITANSWASNGGDIGGLYYLEFLNGIRLDRQDIYQRYLADDTDNIVKGSWLDETLYGYGGSDQLLGWGGSDTFIGGAGNDHIEGYMNSADTYVFNRGDDQDFIKWADDIDTLKLGEGITIDDIDLRMKEIDDWYFYPEQSLIFSLKEDGVAFEDWKDKIEFYQSSLKFNIEFADGTVVNLQDLYERFSLLDGDNVLSWNPDDEYYLGDGNDTLYSPNDGAIIEGGKGNDLLYTDHGNQIFIYQRGDGKDTIDDYNPTTAYYGSSEADRLKFVGGILPEDLLLKIDGIDLIVGLAEEGKSFSELNDTIRIVGWFSETPKQKGIIEFFEFDNGSVLTFDQVENLIGTPEDDYVMSSVKDATLYGRGGNDILDGMAGNDTLIGGTGDDYLNGGNGNDIYVYNLGDGKDTIEESPDLIRSYAEDDKLQFGEGISSEDLRLFYSGDDLVVTFASELLKPEIENQILIKNWYRQNPYSKDYPDRLNTFVFADGTMLDIQGIFALMSTQEDDMIRSFGDSFVIDGLSGNDSIIGSQGNDTLIGGAGDDYIDTGWGADTIEFNLGDGHDTIKLLWSTNTLKFGEGILPEDITTSADGNDLVININGMDSITLVDDFISNGRFQKIVFFDGSVWVHNDLLQLQVTQGDDSIRAYNYTPFNVDALSGNDNILGSEVADVLKGSEGDDTLNGRSGNDIYVFAKGDGRDTIVDYSGRDTILFEEGIVKDDINLTKSGNDLYISIHGTEDQIVVKDHFIAYQNILLDGRQVTIQNPLETLEFSDGMVFPLQTVRKFLVDQESLDLSTINIITADSQEESTGTDLVIGDSGNNVLTGAQGNDVLSGGGGTDTYLFNRGDGIDYIYETSYQNDLIQFGTGIHIDDLRFIVDGNDLIIGLDEMGVLFDALSDKIVIENWTKNHYLPVVLLESGVQLSLQGIVDKLSSQGDDYIATPGGHAVSISALDGNDTIQTSNRDDMIDAGDGNDIIATDSGDDFIDAGKGTDIVDAGDDDDILIGNQGNDYLKGGFGNDTYIYGLGDGHDMIYDAGSYYGGEGEGSGLEDIIQFTDGIENNDLIFVREADDLIIGISDNGTSFNNLENQIRVQNHFTDNNQIETIGFSDGTYLSTNNIEYINPNNNIAPIVDIRIETVILQDVREQSGDVGASDADGDTLTYTVTTQAANGTLSVDAMGIWTYSANPLYMGTDSAMITVDDGNGESVTKTLLFDTKVSAPTLTDAMNNLLEDNTSTGLFNVTNPIGGVLLYEVITPTANGDFAVDADGNWNYNPSQDYNGNDSVIIKVTNEYGLSSTSRLDFVIEAVNDVPIVTITEEAFTLTNVRDISGFIEASDVDGDILGYSVTTQATHGLVSVDSEGNWHYKADGSYNGADSAVITVDDGNGASVLKTLNFTIEGYLYEGNNLIINDTTGDTLVMTNVDKDELAFTRSGDNLLVNVKNEATVTLVNFYTNMNAGVETLQTADGALSLSRDQSVTAETGFFGFTSSADGISDVKNLINGSNNYGDRLSGANLDDILFGYDGNDDIEGLGGNDLLVGGNGNDTLYGNTGDDTLYGDSGNDNLYGNAGNDVLVGGIGSDRLEGGNDDDLLSGGVDDDTLLGGSGNDVLEGGTGNDTLKGATGSDTYIYNIGDGQDLIDDYSTNMTEIDRIAFGANITVDDVTFVRQSYNLFVNLDADNFIKIKGFFNDDNRNAIEEVVFEDGTTLNKTEIISATIVEGTQSSNNLYGLAKLDDTIYGYGGNDMLMGYEGNDTLYGGSGDDRLYGDEGEDILIGGIGNDKLEGYYGNDTYLFSKGDGIDTIEEWSTYGVEETDVIKFTGEVTKEDLSFYMDWDDLIVQYSDTDSITVKYQDSNRSKIERIELADGSYLTNSDIDIIVQNINAYATDNGIFNMTNTMIQGTEEMMNIFTSAWQQT